MSSTSITSSSPTDNLPKACRSKITSRSSSTVIRTSSPIYNRAFQSFPPCPVLLIMLHIYGGDQENGESVPPCSCLPYSATTALSAPRPRVPKLSLILSCLVFHVSFYLRGAGRPCDTTELTYTKPRAELTWLKQCDAVPDQHDGERPRGRTKLSPPLNIPKNRSTGNLAVRADATNASDRARIRFSIDGGSIQAADYDSLARSHLPNHPAHHHCL